MCKISTLTLLFYLYLCVANVFAQPTLKDGTLHPLPQMIDFEDFNGVNLSEIYPGWQEATGVLQPQYAGGGWFGGDVLFDSKTATITFDYLGLNDDWIISSQFVASETTQLSFEAALTRFWDDPAQGNLNFNDSISIMVSTNTETFDFAHHIFSFKQANQPGNQLQRYEFDLSEFAGELIHLAFYATNGQEANSLGAFHLDNIVIKDAAEKDAMPLTLVSPVMNTCLEEQTPVEVEIYNDGTEPVSSVPVKVRVRGIENQNIFGVYPGVLQPGESGVFTVGMMNTSAFGDYRITVSTELPGDEFIQNDQLPGKLFTQSEALSLPLPGMDFIGFYSDNLGELYPGWYEARGKGAPLIRMETDWQGVGYNNARTANVYFTQLGTEDWMVGPLFTATENLVVELRAAVEPYQGGEGMGSDDRLSIMVSADCGQTWEQVHAIDQNNAPGEVLENFRFEIPDFAGQQIMLAFYATTGVISDSQQYYFHVTDIEIKSLYATDVAVTRILSPGNSCGFSDNEELVVEVVNLGSEEISDFDLAFVLNDQDPVVETLSESLSYNESTVYTFNTTLDLTQNEENTISVYTLHPQDENPENDGIYDWPLLLSSFDLSAQGQYTMGFEQDEDFSDWLVEDGNNDNTEWELTDDSQYANSGNFSFSYFSNQTSQQSNDWLFSPCFQLQAGETYKVSFFYRNRATNFPESLKLNIGQQQTPGAMNQELIDLGEISNSGYLEAETEFTVDESGSYYMGFHAYGDADQFGMHIDDITFYQVFDTDISLEGFKVPRLKDENCMLLPVEEMQVKVWNAGTAVVDAFDINVEIDGADLHTFEVQESIDPGESIWIDLIDGGFSLDPYRNYEILVWHELDDDLNKANDTIRVENFMHAQYAMSFEEDEDFEDWTIESLSGSNEWFVSTEGDVANTGNNSFAIRTDSGSGNTANDDWLYSGCFYLEAGKCYEISFYYRSRFSTENLTVYMGSENTPDAMNTTLIDLPSFNSNTYQFVSQQFSVEESGSYYFGWHTDGPTSGRYYIYVDDISIGEDAGSQPVADPTVEILDLEVFFQANAGNYSSLEWDFGDGNTSEEEEVFHVYDEPGTYEVSLSLGSGCVDVLHEFTMEITCDTNAGFSSEATNNEVSFVAQGGAVEYEWDFGDETVGWGDTVSHTYDISEAQTFTVVMTAYFACGDQVVSQEVNVSPEQPTTYGVSVETNLPEVVTITGEGEYEEGEQVNLTAELLEDGLAIMGWYDDEVLLSEELTYTFEMPANDVSLYLELTVLPSVGNMEDYGIAIYPNPSSDFFTIQSETRLFALRVTDLSGRTVYSINQSEGFYEYSLKTSDLGEGIYLIHLRLDKDSVLYQKIQVVD